jgi:hypothetical protein
LQCEQDLRDEAEEEALSALESEIQDTEGLPLESEPKKVPLRKWTGNEITPPWEVGMEEMYRKNPRRAVYTDLPLRLLQDICDGV